MTVYSWLLPNRAVARAWSTGQQPEWEGPLVEAMGLPAHICKYRLES